MSKYLVHKKTIMVESWIVEASSHMDAVAVATKVIADGKKPEKREVISVSWKSETQ